MASYGEAQIGVDSNLVVPGSTVVDLLPFTPGATSTGFGGKLLIFAKATTAIPKGTAVCAITAPAFTAAASGGTYASSTTTDLAVGDYGWFSKSLI